MPIALLGIRLAEISETVRKPLWRNYVSKMNLQISVTSVWNRIRKVKGNDTSHIVHDLSVNDREVTSHRDFGRYVFT